MHQLDLAFHLSRHAGSVSRIMDRGSRGINFALNSLLFNIVPTAFEIGIERVFVCECVRRVFLFNIVPTAFEIGIEKNRISATPPALTPAKSPNPR